MFASTVRCRLSKTMMMLLLAAAALLPSTGCMGLLATGIYFWEGGNFVDGECDKLDEKRVVVVCRPPSSQEYSHAGASRELAKRISRLLKENVPDIDIVNPREVDNWIDESDGEDFLELGRAVKADIVLHVELDSFDLYKGKTLYQGNSNVTVSVYDINDGGDLAWDKDLGEVLYPRNSGIPAQDKTVQSFQREFVGILASEISVLFYRHDPHILFAIDSMANH